MRPQYKSKTFTTKAAFEKWLSNLTHIKVAFKDLGGDLSVMWIHKTGEILNCDFHSFIYNGKFVELPVELEKPIKIYFGKKEGYKTMGGLIIESFEIVNP